MDAVVQLSFLGITETGIRVREANRTPRTHTVLQGGQNILDSYNESHHNLRTAFDREVSGIHKPAQTSFGAQLEFT